MTVARLEDFAEVRSGGTPSRAKSIYYGGSIPWAKISDLDSPAGLVEATEETITEAGLQAIRGRLFPVGTLLFAIYGSIGKMAFAGVPISTNQAILGIEIKRRDELDGRYLYRWLESRNSQFEKDGQGIAQKNLSAAYLRELEITLPRIEDQRRIASILDRADDLRRKRREAIERLDSLKRSFFEQLMKDSMSELRATNLGEIVSEFRYGTSEKSSVTGLPILRIPNVIGNVITVDDLKYIDLEEAEFERLRLTEGDLLFVRTNGNPEYVGRSAVVTSTLGNSLGRKPEDFVYASYLIRARLRPNSVEPIFLQACLTNTEARKAILARAKTSAGQFNINIEGLGSIPLSLPTLASQRRFVKDQQAVDQLATSHRAHLAKLDTLFAALQHRAFRGEL